MIEQDFSTKKKGCREKLTAMIFISLMAVTNLLLQQNIQPLKLAKRCDVLSRLWVDFR